MKTYLGLGANVGDRRANLEAALVALRNVSSRHRVSPVYETPAMTPEGAPDNWNRPFLNAVAEIEFKGNPRQLLELIKKIEARLGREPDGERWAPRPIDIDILWMEGVSVSESDLIIPHIGLEDRSFVLAPLKEIAPDLKLPSGRTALAAFRALETSLTSWMTIVNATPDSFSDGGAFSSGSTFEATLTEADRYCVQIVDVGAESTKPNGKPVPEEEEWRRLRPFLGMFASQFSGRVLRPRLSVDTRRASIAEKALEHGADIINDVGFGRDLRMVDVLRSSDCDYCVAHSVTAPVDPTRTLPPSLDVVAHLKQIATDKLDELATNGVAPARVIFDPGIGFGKTWRHNLDILKRVEELLELPCRIAIGHSRKSFMKLFSERAPDERDAETLGISMRLAATSVDWIRVHQGTLHARAALAFRHLDW